MMKSLAWGLGAVLLMAAPAWACDTINSKVVKMSVCVDDTDWVLQAPQGAQELLYYNADQTLAFTLITEKETFPVSDFRSAILANAVSGAGDGATIDDVNILSERIENVGGKPWNVIEYQVGKQGGGYIFQNFYYVQPGFGSTQFIFWSLPDAATAAAYRAGQMLTDVAFN
ncbi:hypothetical protein [Devosia sp.]|uniref:hypothetical protein n=1 Tax=Devosia sp. TaxID=1871048 RepID=UPI003BAD29B1